MQIYYCFKKNYTGVSKSVLRKLLLLLLAYWGSTVASLLSINPPFSPTYLSITLSLLFRGRGKTHPGKKKKTLSPNTENSRDPYLAILSRVVCTPVIPLPRSLLHCTPYWCYNNRHSWDRRTALEPQSSCEARTVTTEVCKFDFTSTHTRQVSLHWRRKSRGPKSSERGNKTEEEEVHRVEGGGRLGRCQNSGPMLEEPTRQPRQP